MPNFQKLGGWIEPKKRSREVAASFEAIQSTLMVFGSAAASIAGTGRGKTVLLYKVLESIGAQYYSGTIQLIGDCVSFGYAKAIDISMAVDIKLRGENEVWPGATTATEWIYGTSRVLQGRKRLGNDDGSLGAWAQAAIKEHGTLLRKVYGQHDLRAYCGDRAKLWGYKDLPLELEAKADLHPVKTTALMETYEDARDAIANGYPVPVCSTQGFDNVRDNQGFARPKGKWPHCMCFVAVDDSGDRPGLLCDNRSWGPDWISGPKRHQQPDGTFWVDADVADSMLRQGDSYAISGHKGYQSRFDGLDYNLFA